MFAASLRVDAASLEPRQFLEQIASQAVFCHEYHALCTRAACVAAGDRAQCGCEVVAGWAMGPQKCSARGPFIENGHTFVWSSYSTQFNDQGRTLTCADAQTAWADCYGARCEVDRNDPKKATCTCPIVHGAMSTLGGNCNRTSCSGLWSAMPPDAHELANRKFYTEVLAHQWAPADSVKQPAQACPAP